MRDYRRCRVQRFGRCDSVRITDNRYQRSGSEHNRDTRWPDGDVCWRRIHGIQVELGVPSEVLHLRQRQAHRPRWRDDARTEGIQERQLQGVDGPGRHQLSVPAPSGLPERRYCSPGAIFRAGSSLGLCRLADEQHSKYQAGRTRFRRCCHPHTQNLFRR